jgi:hypothetical protein
MTSLSSSQLDWSAAVLGLTAATLIGLSNAGNLPPPAARSSHASFVLITSDQAATMSAQPVTMQIVPANVSDPNTELFIGTGDGSAGFWTRP